MTGGKFIPILLKKKKERDEAVRIPVPLTYLFSLVESYLGKGSGSLSLKS